MRPVDVSIVHILNALGVYSAKLHSKVVAQKSRFYARRSDAAVLSLTGNWASKIPDGYLFTVHTVDYVKAVCQVLNHIRSSR